MTQKQAIRKLLTNTEKFIIGDYNGQKWYCPDAFIATVDDIYSQYRPKKSQDVTAFTDPNKQPKMNTIIERDGQYVPVQSIVPGEEQTLLVTDKMTVTVNTEYLQFMQVLYPTAQLWTDTAYSYSPVQVMVRDYIKGDDQVLKVVALIMPLHN